MDFDRPAAAWSEALAFAVARHGTAVRKGTRVPYVTHVVAVAEALARYYPEREDLTVAGLLHDVVEDTATSFEEVAAAFGPRVAALVRAVSKDDDAMFRALGSDRAAFLAGLEPDDAREALWLARREHLLRPLRDRTVPHDVLRLKAADALANLRSIARDLADPAVGEAVWARFRVDRERSLWFYEEVVRAVEASLMGEPLVSELREAFERVRGWRRG